MKFKEQIGSRYIFDGGNGEELVLDKYEEPVRVNVHYEYEDVIIFPNLSIQTCGTVYYSDIQTAVQMMQILKDEGVV